MRSSGILGVLLAAAACGQTITTIQSTDLVSDSRAVINTNFSELYTKMFRLGVYNDLTEITTPATSPASGFLRVYVVSGSGICWRTSAGVQTCTGDHILDTANPHATTKTHVGLANVSNDAQLKIASNLSDLNNSATARTNLGLGGAAVLSVGTITGTVAAGDDGRLSDARTPVAHKTSHATGGSDVMTASDIGLGSVDNTSDATKNSASVTLTNKTITTPVLYTYTVGTLPAAGTAGRLAVVSDAATAGSCTSGSGSSTSLCRDTGAAWAPVGDGGGGAITETVVFRTVCQNTIAGPNFSTPATNPPTFGCVTGANAGDVSTAATAWNFGVLSFAENVSEATGQSVQGMIPLSATWSASAGITADLTWRTSATSGDVLWRIQGQCVADAEVAGNFSAPSSFTADTAKGTTLQLNTVAQKTLTTSDVLAGCAAGEMFLFRLWRDATQGTDTLAAAADLISARFTLTR